MIKKTHIQRILVAIILITGFLTNSITLKIGKNTVASSKQILNHHQDIQSISGTLLIGPNIGDQWIEQIRQTADKKLEGQVYNITEKRIKKLFQEKSSQETQIRIIMENKQYQQFKNYYKNIEETMSGYPSFYLKNDRQMDTNFVHSKFFITDTLSFIQTNNLTHAGLFKNKEHVLITNHTGIQLSLSQIFEKDREGDPISLDDIHPNLLVCNINCREVIESLLSNAKKSIYIATQYITDPSIQNIIKEKQKNIETKIIVADTKSNDDLQFILDPQTRKRYTHKAYLHTKTILIDEEIFVVGSINLSKNSLDNNREVAIMLNNPKLIEKFLEDFLYDRSSL